jgi:hypothetical protein
MVDDILVWINTYQGAITATATVVLTATTMVYAWLTAILAKENKLLREAGTEPEIVAYLSPHPRFTGGLVFILANIGRGPALNILFRVTAGGDDFAAHKVRLQAPSIPLTVIPQGDSYQSFFGMGWEAFAEPRLQAFTVEVKYKDLKQREHVRVYILDVGQFEGRITIGDEPEEEIATALKKIAEEMQKWTRSNLPVETELRSDRQKRDREQFAKFKGGET